MKIGIVVVTYNRLDCLKKNQKAIAELKVPDDCSVVTIVVNNNSTDETKKWLIENSCDNRIIVTLNENIGGAGGFHQGMKKALSLGVDYIWGMDDDAYPEQNALEGLYVGIEQYGSSYCYWSNCKSEALYKDQYHPVEGWMFVGFCLPAEAVKKIGLPRDDFFIFYDDMEYSDRALKNGYKIIWCRDSKIIHKDSFSNQKEKKFGALNVSIPAYPDWKMYYYIRNRILRYPSNEWLHWKAILLGAPKHLLKILVVNPSQFGIAFKGYLDGIAGKTGKTISP